MASSFDPIIAALEQLSIAVFGAPAPAPGAVPLVDLLGIERRAIRGIDTRLEVLPVLQAQVASLRQGEEMAQKSIANLAKQQKIQGIDIMKIGKHVGSTATNLTQMSTQTKNQWRQKKPSTLQDIIDFFVDLIADIF